MRVLVSDGLLGARGRGGLDFGVCRPSRWALDSSSDKRQVEGG